MKKGKVYLLSFAVGLAVLALAVLVSKDWGSGAAIASIAYGLLVSFFLFAQLYGFVFSQVHYSESVEKTKFKVLEVEGIPCEKL